ncbi:hypothetical protein CA831_23055, partial [Burkholderia multivorans]
AVAGRGGAVPVVDGLRIDTGVSVALLIAAALLATRVRPDAHRDAHRDAHGGRRPLQTTD